MSALTKINPDHVHVDISWLGPPGDKPSNEMLARSAAAQALRAAGLDELAREIEDGCLTIKAGEPFFVLRAQDLTAAESVRGWIRMNTNTAPVHKLNAATAIMNRMERWAGRRKDAD